MNAINMKQVLFVNNTCHDVRSLHPHFVEYLHTGKVHEDIEDIFKLKLITHKDPVDFMGKDIKYRVIIDWL